MFDIYFDKKFQHLHRVLTKEEMVSLPKYLPEKHALPIHTINIHIHDCFNLFYNSFSLQRLLLLFNSFIHNENMLYICIDVILDRCNRLTHIARMFTTIALIKARV